MMRSMRNAYIVGLLAVLMVPGTSAFAQFRQLAKRAANFQKLETSVKRAALNQVKGKPVISAWVPKTFVAGEQVGLTGVALPSQVNIATVSFFYKNSEFPHLSAPEVGAQFLVGSHGMPPAGKAFYEDQSELAQHLDTFYEGRGVTSSVGNRTVKLYSLPVDGILYKPAGYQEPVVLNSDEYFVVYDIDSHAGKLVENTPENLEFYNRPGDSRAFEEVVDFNGQTYHISLGAPELPRAAAPSVPQIEQEITRISRENGMDLDHPDFFTVQPSPAIQRDMRAQQMQMATTGLPSATGQVAWHQVLEENRARVAALRERNVYEDVWEAMDASKFYVSQRSLGRDLSDFYGEEAPQLFNKETRQVGYVYEIPVNGIEYMSPGTMPFTLDPRTQVFFYAKDGSGRLYDRDVLEDPTRFSAVEEPSAQELGARAWYEKNYQAFAQQRQSQSANSAWEIEQFPPSFTSQDALSQALHRYHQGGAPEVTNVFTRQSNLVYEIPVKGITYAPEGATPRVLDPETEVVLFNAQTNSGQLVARSQLDNPIFFTFKD